jgi:hypothetical protein
MPTSRKFMGHGGSQITKIISGSGINNLSQLNDVALSLPLSDNEALIYNSTASKWTNETVASAGGTGVSGSTQYWGATQSTYIPIWISGNAIGRSSLKVEAAAVPYRFQGFEYRYNPADEDYLMAKLDYVSSSAVTGGQFAIYDINDVAWIALKGGASDTSLFMNYTGFGSTTTAGIGRINVSGAISLDEGAGSDSTVYLKTIVGQDADLEIRSHNDLKIRADTGGVSSKQRITLEGYNYLISGAQTQGPVMAISGTSGGSGYGAQVAIVPYNTVGGVGMSETWYGTDSQNFNVYGTTLLSGATTISGTLGLWDTLDLYADLDLNLNDLWNVKDFTASGSTFFVSGNATTFKNADFTVNSDTNTGDFSILSGAYHQFKVDYDTNSIGMAYATPKTNVAVGIGGFAQGKTAAHLALYNYHTQLAFIASSTTGANPDLYLSGTNNIILQAPDYIDIQENDQAKIRIGQDGGIKMYTSGTTSSYQRFFMDTTGAAMFGNIYRDGDPLSGYQLDVRGDAYISGTTITDVLSGTTAISGNSVYGRTHSGSYGRFYYLSGTITSGTVAHAKQASIGMHQNMPTQTGSNGYALSVGHSLGQTRDIAIYGTQGENHGIRFISGTVGGGTSTDFTKDRVGKIFSNLSSTNPYIAITNEIGNKDLYVTQDGIGIETSSPAEALHVAGKILATHISGTTSISGATFYGDGSNLTGISESAHVSSSTAENLAYYVNTTDVSGTATLKYDVADDILTVSTMYVSGGRISFEQGDAQYANVTVWGEGVEGMTLGTDTRIGWFNPAAPVTTLNTNYIAGNAITHDLRFFTSGAQTLYLTSNSRVGVSMVFDDGFPTQELDVRGNAFISGTLVATGISGTTAVSGSYLYGDGSNITGISAGATTQVSSSTQYDVPFYVNTSDISGNTGFTYNGTNVDMKGNLNVSGNTILSGTVELENDWTLQGVSSTNFELDNGTTLKYRFNNGRFQTVHAGTAAAPTLVDNNDTTTGIFYPGTNDWGVSTDGTLALYVGASQQVNLHGALNVSGNTIVSGNLGANLSIAPAYPIHVSQSSGDTYGMYMVNDAGRGLRFGDTSADGTGYGKIEGLGGSLFLGATQIYTSFLGTADTDVTLGSAGRRWGYFFTRFGQAGYSTSAAEDTRYVWGVSSSAEKDPFIVRTHGQAGPTFIVTSGGNVSGSGAISGSTFYGDGSNLTGITHTTSQVSSSTANNLAYYVNTTDVSGNTDLVWDTANGRLGIGTSSPAQSLDVRGNIYIKSSQSITWANGDASIAEGQDENYSLSFNTYDTGVSNNTRALWLLGDNTVNSHYDSSSCFRS